MSTTACFGTHWQSDKAAQAALRSSLSGLEARVIVRSDFFCTVCDAKQMGRSHKMLSNTPDREGALSPAQP